MPDHIKKKIENMDQELTKEKAGRDEAEQNLK